MNFVNKNKGFTLVELAIVIVIIGLLVGGVLTGQSLIDAAKVNRAISDFKKYEAAMLTFKAKYNAVPGDMRNAYTFFDGSGGSTICGPNNTTATGCNGDNDGIIQRYFYTGTGEQQRAWVHLSLAKLINDVQYEAGQNYYSKVTTTPGTNTWPISSIADGANFSLMCERYGNNSFPNLSFWGRTGMWIQLSKYYGSAGVGNGLNTMGSVMTPSMAQAIDTKYDDGFPTLGNLIGSRAWYTEFGTNCLSTTSHMTQITSGDTTIAYSVAERRPTCTVLFYLSSDY